MNTEKYVNSSEAIYKLNGMRKRFVDSNSNYELLLTKFVECNSSSVNIQKEALNKIISNQKLLIDKIDKLKNDISFETRKINKEIELKKNKLEES